MKKSLNYFLTESTLALTVESTFLTVESITALPLSATAFTVESTVAFVLSTAAAAESVELLQDATKAPMARTKRSFFICLCFVCKIMVRGLYGKNEKVTRF